MEFGVFLLAQQRGYHQSSEHVIRNTIEQTIMAEQAGFSSAWYAEHHFNNYSLSPSPLMTIAHIAAKTRTIRLGTAVCILPLYNPSRLLAEIGFVDTVSNGRLDLGVGSGYQEFEFERFGVKIAESGAIYNEFMDVLPLGLTQKTFEYHGKYLDIPPSSIAVRCLQQVLPGYDFISYASTGNDGDGRDAVGIEGWEVSLFGAAGATSVEALRMPRATTPWTSAEGTAKPMPILPPEGEKIAV